MISSSPSNEGSMSVEEETDGVLSPSPMLQEVPPTKQQSIDVSPPCGANPDKDVPEARSTPLPMKQIAVIIAVCFCEGVNINMMFPLLVFMVEDQGQSGEDLGTQSGILASCQCLAQLFSSLIWGVISDRLPRRYCVSFGCLGCALAISWFGVATTFSHAIAARLLGGLLNGNVLILKAHLTLITDATNRTRGFVTLPLSWSIAVVVAPTFSGLLVKPSRSWPDSSLVGVGSLFDDYPYLLPCLVAACFNVLASLVCLCWMSDEVDETSAMQLPLEEAEEDCGFILSPTHTVRNDDGHVSSPPNTPTDSVVSTTCSSVVSVMGRKEGHDLDIGSGMETTIVPEVPLWDILTSRPVVSVLTVYGLLCTMYIVQDETFPLIAKWPVSDGGLGFVERDIGVALCVSGAVMMPWTLFVVPWIDSMIGRRRTLRLGLIPAIFIFAITPMVAYLSNEWQMQSVALWVGLSLKQMAGAASFSPVMVMVGNSVPRSRVGAVNGVGQTVAGLARGLGPYLGGLFWSITTHDPNTLPGVFGNFIAISSLAVLSLAVCSLLPSSLEISREEMSVAKDKKRAAMTVGE